MFGDMIDAKIAHPHRDATYESVFHAVRGSSFQKVRLRDLDGPLHSAVRIELSFELLAPTSLRLVKEAPHLELPEPGARDPCSLIQADVEAELEVVDPAGLERLADGVVEGIDVERVKREPTGIRPNSGTKDKTCGR